MENKPIKHKFIKDKTQRMKYKTQRIKYKTQRIKNKTQRIRDKHKKHGRYTPVARLPILAVGEGRLCPQDVALGGKSGTSAQHPLPARCRTP